MSETNPGTWRAVLSDADGNVVDPATHDGREVHISVRRGTALPVDGRLPGTWWAGDVHPLDGGPSADADVAARLAWARMVADHLNATGVVSVRG